MSYLVLARKYRPHTFAEMVGQEHVVQALSNALHTQRLHHAWLFTGTRGVGKTTVSRILAKSLNCTGADGQGGITATPCGVCPSCVEIDAGRFVDYTELDAASNRGVDEVQALLEQAIYKPVQGRFKVFMIDEVHMLTHTAFNAMLKTLEEPPEYLKFVLATTDPQKVPITVLSRCLQFNLRPIPPEIIVAHLQHVLQREDIPADSDALHLLARAAQGSMRDALSLTDQAIAWSAGAQGTDGLQGAAIRQMLGSVDSHSIYALLQALAQGQAQQVVELVRALQASGQSAAHALQEMVRALQRMAVWQLAPDAMQHSDLPPDEADICRLAAALPADETQLLYSLCLHGQQELGLAPDEYAALLMVLLRLFAFKPPAAVDGANPHPVAADASETMRITPASQVQEHAARPPLHIPDQTAAHGLHAPDTAAAAVHSTNSAADGVSERAPNQQPQQPDAPQSSPAPMSVSEHPSDAPTAAWGDMLTDTSTDTAASMPAPADAPLSGTHQPRAEAERAAPVQPVSALPITQAVVDTVSAPARRPATAAMSSIHTAAPSAASAETASTTPPQMPASTPPDHQEQQRTMRDVRNRPSHTPLAAPPDRPAAPVVPVHATEPPPWEDDSGTAWDAYDAATPEGEFARHEPVYDASPHSQPTPTSAQIHLVPTALGDVWCQIAQRMQQQFSPVGLVRELLLQTQLLAQTPGSDGAADVWTLRLEKDVLNHEPNRKQLEHILGQMGYRVLLAIENGQVTDTPALRQQQQRQQQRDQHQTAFMQHPIIQGLVQQLGAQPLSDSIRLVEAQANA